MPLDRDQMSQVDHLRETEGLGSRKIAERIGATRSSVRRYMESSDVDRLSGPDALPDRPARQVNHHPKGWEPGVAWQKDGTGHLTAKVEGEGLPDFEAVLRHFGFDPAEYSVDGDRVHVRTWDMNLGRDPVTGETCVRTAYYYRATVMPRAKDDRDIEKLKEQIAAYSPKYGRAPAEGAPGTFVLNLTDWQTGKRDGDGVTGLIERVGEMTDAAVARVEELRAAGRQLGTLLVAGLGDLLEGCKGHYPQQSFTVQLNRREQVNVTRRLLLQVLTALAPMFPRAVVVAVPGNHGENRNDAGKSFTTDGDNDDVGVFDQVADVMSVQPAFSHVSFVIPRDELTVTLDVEGQIVNFAHGHQLSRGGTPSAKAEEWIKGQAFGMQAAGDAGIFVTGHFHHFAAFQQGARTWLQAPSLEDRSKYFEDRRGITTNPGTLSFVVTAGGWSDLAIL